MQKIKFNSSNLKITLIFVILYFNFNWFYFNEDSLGGAKGDFNYHYKISLAFSKNFLKLSTVLGHKKLQWEQEIHHFWIILSQVSKFISYEILRIINSFVSILICLYFLNV